MVRFLVQYGPATVGLLIALALLVFNRAKRVDLPRPVRLMTGLSLTLVTIFYSLFYALRVWPGWQLPLPLPSGIDSGIYMQAFTFMLPLALTLLTLPFLVFPMPAAGPQGIASLAPRGFKTFTSRYWILATGTLALCSILVAIIAGLASSPDEQGRHVRYVLEFSNLASSSSGIYGWWFSIPSLTLMTVVIAVASWGISAITRPTLATDAEFDTKVRSVRVRNILTVTCGGLLLHLATIFDSLAGTASLRGGLSGDNREIFSFFTPFSALRPALLTVGFACLILGLAIWWFVTLSALTAKSTSPSKALAS